VSRVRENRMHGSTGGGWKRDPQGYRASRLPNRHRESAAAGLWTTPGDLARYVGTPSERSHQLSGTSSTTSPCCFASPWSKVASRDPRARASWAR
jgi:hypothetical protein